MRVEPAVVFRIVAVGGPDLPVAARAPVPDTTDGEQPEVKQDQRARLRQRDRVVVGAASTGNLAGPMQGPQPY
jgi:hypothetical protein